VSFRFQFRRGTTAERDASNPILAAGEPAVVLDSGQPAELVLGDGVTAMADLRAAVWDDDARLALAGTATQPGDLGTAAAADVGDFATAAQGVLADSATQPGDLGTAAATDATDYLTGVGQATLTTRVLNGDDNVLLTIGTGQAVNAQHQVYLATISPHGAGTNTVNTLGAAAGGIGFNIGQWVVNATDGAANITRTTEWCNIEHDFIQFEQVGGSAVFNRVVSSRFRFSIPKTGVTIVDNKGIDFVVPNVSDVTGAVTNYIAINIPALTGGGGTNFYGIKFNNAPNGGSIVSVNNDLVLKTLTANTAVTLAAASGGDVNLQPGSGGALNVGGTTGTFGSMQLTPGINVSGVRARLIYGTDGTGYKFAIAKNVAGTITDLLKVEDHGDVTVVRGLGVFGAAPPSARPTVAGSRAGNAALASLLTALAATGLITDGTSA